MRTTVNLEADVLAAVREIARSEKTSLGHVLSRLTRSALTGNVAQADATTAESENTTGFVPFPARGAVVTNERVNELRTVEVV